MKITRDEVIEMVHMIRNDGHAICVVFNPGTRQDELEAAMQKAVRVIPIDDSENEIQERISKLEKWLEKHENNDHLTEDDVKDIVVSKIDSNYDFADNKDLDEVDETVSEIKGVISQIAEACFRFR
jgi:hypothetical protein